MTIPALDGRAITKVNLTWLRQQIGLVSQEPTLYDEWLSQERVDQQTVTQSPRRQSVPLRPGDTAAATTIRSVTPDDPVDLVDNENMDAVLPERGTTSFERTFIPRTTTTIVGGAAALNAASSPSSAPPKSRKLVKERQWEREARLASHSPPSSRNGSNVSGMLGRSISKTNGTSSNGHRPHVASMIERDAPGSARQRTRTLEERTRDRSPTDIQAKNRSRGDSVNVQGAEYLASVPAIAPLSAPSISSFNAPVQAVDDVGRRSTSRAFTRAVHLLKYHRTTSHLLLSRLQHLLQPRLRLRLQHPPPRKLQNLHPHRLRYALAP